MTSFDAVYVASPLSLDRTKAKTRRSHEGDRAQRTVSRYFNGLWLAWSGHVFTGFLRAFNPIADRIFRVSKGLIHRQAHCYTAWQIRKYHPTNPVLGPDEHRILHRPHLRAGCGLLEGRFDDLQGVVDVVG